MPITNARIYRIETTDLNLLQNKQIGYETTVDPDLNFKMFGYKSALGVVYRFLAKDRDARVSNLEVTGSFDAALLSTNLGISSPIATLDIRITGLQAAAFGTVADPGEVYIAGFAINSGYNQNNDTTALSLNLNGYLGGTTKYRDLKIGDGKGTYIASFAGATGAQTNTAIIGATNLTLTGQTDLFTVFARTDFNNGVPSVFSATTLGEIKQITDAGSGTPKGGINLRGINLDPQVAGLKFDAYKRYDDTFGNTSCFDFDAHVFEGSTVKSLGASAGGDVDLSLIALFKNNGTAELRIDKNGGIECLSTGDLSFASGDFVVTGTTGDIYTAGDLNVNGLMDVDGSTGRITSIGIDSNDHARIGAATEKVCINTGAIGFNRNTPDGVIYDNTRHAYQFLHTPDPSALIDNLSIQVYNPAGGQVEANAFKVDGTGLVTTKTQVISTNLILSKASTGGIKVDPAAPTYGWRDILGQITLRGAGTDPQVNVYRTPIRQFQWPVGRETFIDYHIPHDYVLGSDLFLHIHHSHIGTNVTGGTITFTAEMSYAKGHNQAAFSAVITATLVAPASATQYQHMLYEIQISATSPSGSQFDTAIIEPDGIIMMRFASTANGMTTSGGGAPDPFVHEIDLHYQSTELGTKQKAPPFYT